jgi:hypothetical protein
MKLTLEVRVDGGMRLPFTADVDTLGQLGKLGRMLQDTPAKIARLLPDLKGAKITGAKLTAE